MNLALFYDTETSGLPLFSEPSEHPDQPHIVQLAACLVDLDNRQTIASMDVIVQPDGWTIPPEVSTVHGITTEHALAVGIPEEVALNAFMHLWDGRTLVAHNESFDRRIIRIGQHRFKHTAKSIDGWKGCKAECTQLLSTPIVKAPPTAKMRAAGRNHFKSANLREAYLHFTGRELKNAHSAMADVQGCMEVYFAIKGAPVPALKVA